MPNKTHLYKKVVRVYVPMFKAWHSCAHARSLVPTVTPPPPFILITLPRLQPSLTISVSEVLGVGRIFSHPPSHSSHKDGPANYS